jgi:hypothetical protein
MVHTVIMVSIINGLRKKYDYYYYYYSSRWFLARGFFYPENGGDRFPPKRLVTQDIHGATSQKTEFFIGTAVKTSDVTKCFLKFRVCMCKYERMCTSLTPELVDGLYSYSVFKRVSATWWCSMNIIIIAPKQEPFKWAPKTQNGDLWKTVH